MEEKMTSLEQIEADLIDMWSNHRVQPEITWIGTSFGVVTISKDGYCLYDEVLNQNRHLTTDEMAQFKAEFPSLFEKP